MKKIGFIGFGLIGGSLAKIWRKNHSDYVLLAYNYKKEKNRSLESAKEDEILTDIVYNISNFSDCDIIVLSAPVISNVKYLKELKNIVKEEVIITDVGSVKGEISEEAKKLGLEDKFIGGHPMAGSEKTGYTNANINLFENAYYILTPFSSTKKEKLETLKALITETKSVVVMLDAVLHDKITALISHVPHIIASSLVEMVSDIDSEEGELATLAAGGFRDITRIASSSPEMWRDICLSNSNSISYFLDKYIEKIKAIKEIIDAGKAEGLYNFFENSKEYRDSLPLKKSNMAISHEILLYVPDEIGSIAILASILFSKGISIKNIGIAHNREYSDGVLRIEFYDNFSREVGLLALKERNYKIFEK